MKLFTKNTFRTVGLSLLAAMLLSSCGGGGSCAGCSTSTPATGDITLTLTAPNQYPAGVAVTAYLTMTNTSVNNASNLYYAVPSASNYTGAIITVANGVGNNPCVNIAAGQSCTFPAQISADSHPGSFTVTATPNGSSPVGSAKRLWNTLKSDLGLQAATLSLTANIGLTELPANTETGANGISFLYSPTIAVNESGETLISIVGVVNSASVGSFNTINLTNQSGDLLNFSVLSNNSGSGATSLANGSIVTFLLHIPAGTASSYQFYAQTMQNGALVNQGTNVNPINLSSSKAGILVVQPTDFNLIASSGYESQVITYTNIGNGDISGLSIAQPLSPLSLSSNSCVDNLAAGSSCTVILTSNAPNGVSGTGSLTANYNNGTTPATVVSQYNYAGLNPQSGISLSAVNNFAFTANTVMSSESTQVTLTNTGNVMESNFGFSFSPNQYFTLSTGTSGTPCILSGNTVVDELGTDQSCTVTLIYSNNTAVGGSTTMTVNYNYNGSLSGSSSKTLTYNTDQATANFSVIPASPYTFAPILTNNQVGESTLFTYTNNGPDVASSIAIGAITGDSGYFSVQSPVSPGDCANASNLVIGQTCTITVKFGPNSTAKDAVANLPITITSATGGSSTFNTGLIGSVQSPGMAFLTATSVTATDAVSFGFLNESTPYWLNPNTNGVLKFTITNTGTATATNIQYQVPQMGFCPIDTTNTTCGNVVASSTSTLAVGQSCTLQFTCNQPTGSMDVGSGTGVFIYNDEAHPVTKAVQNPVITPFGVNIVVPATVSAVMSYESNGSNPITSVKAESDFYVVYTLSGGYNVGDNTYGVNLSNAHGGTPPMTAYSPNTCTLSGTQPTCYIKINAGGSVQGESIGYVGQGSAISPTPSASSVFNVTGKFAYVLGTNRIYSFDYNSTTGALIAGSSTSAYGDSSVGIVGSIDGKYIYVVDQTQSMIKSFAVNTNNGVLTFIESTPTGTAPGTSSLRFDHAGKYLYTTAVGSTNISIFSYNAINGHLTLEHTIMGGSQPSIITFTPDDKFAYVSNSLGVAPPNVAISARVYMYQVGNDGNLTPLSPESSIQSLKNNPYDSIVDPTGKFLYVTNVGPLSGGLNLAESSISIYDINQSTGQLSYHTGQSIFDVESAPVSIIMNDTNKYMYTANAVSGSISQLAVDSISGNLSSLLPSTVNAGMTPVSLTFSPNGKFIYSVSQYGNFIQMYSYDLLTGLMLPSGSTTPTGSTAQSGFIIFSK